MANVGVPLKFQILKGDELIREQVVTEAVIKVGKLASSHLRIDDESVSRMHAVIEINGTDDVQLIDLGSTRGTLVNGEKVTKARLSSGDEITFGDVRVVVTFLDSEATAVAPAPVMAANVAATAVLPQRPVAPPAAPYAPPAAPYQPAPPQQPQYAAPPPAYAPPPRPAPPPQYAAPPPAYAPPPLGAGGAGHHMAAEVEVHDGTRAVEVQALYRGVVINTRHLFDAAGAGKGAQSKGLLLGGVALMAVALITFLVTVIDVGKEKEEYERHLAAGKEMKTFFFKSRSAGLDVLVFGGLAVGLALVYMGLKRGGKQANPNFLIGTDKDVDAPVDPQYTGGGSMALVSAAGGDFVI
ncbi:MAG TPA: FHA domain-containing protein, partial [Polyangia bacterium]|nr:FHA domain-containing protein [Polyangia bacterium]